VLSSLNPFENIPDDESCNPGGQGEIQQ
jgi:hypothetical protein